MVDPARVPPYLLTGGRARGTDVVLAARAALQAQFLGGGLVGQVHDHAAGLAGADHVGLLALAARGGLGASAVIGILERSQTPATDDLVGANARRHFRRDSGLGVRRRIG